MRRRVAKNRSHAREDGPTAERLRLERALARFYASHAPEKLDEGVPRDAGAAGPNY